MITDALITVGLAIWSALVFMVDLIPVPDASASMSSLMGDLSVISNNMAALGFWIPWNVAGAVIVTLWGVFGAVVAIRAVRIVVSLVTGGGGSGA